MASDVGNGSFAETDFALGAELTECSGKQYNSKLELLPSFRRHTSRTVTARNVDGLKFLMRGVGMGSFAALVP